jgi:hypothetical protein
MKTVKILDDCFGLHIEMAGELGDALTGGKEFSDFMKFPANRRAQNGLGRNARVRSRLGSGRTVFRGGLSAVIAMATGTGVSFAEVGQQRPTAAIPCLAKLHHGPEARFAARPLRFRALFDEVAVNDGIPQVKKQQALRWLPVASSATNFLIIAFQVFWQVSVNDETNVGFVDAHSESNCGDHQCRVIEDEALLVAPPNLVLQAGMVGQCWPAVQVEAGAKFVGVFPRATVNNAGLAAMPFEERKHLGEVVAAGFDGKEQIPAIETGDKLA